MNRTLLTWTRTIHIYLTMAAMALMLFFALTGITVNHEEWFGATIPKVHVISGTTPSDAVEKKDHLTIVEHLRSHFPITGEMTTFDEFDDRFEVTFKGPGRACTAEIIRPDGKTKITFTSMGLFGRVNDLHRARDTGETWRWMVDASAVVIILAAITGIILWLALPKRRKLGIVATILGTGGLCGVLLAGGSVKYKTKNNAGGPHDPPALNPAMPLYRRALRPLRSNTLRIQSLFCSLIRTKRPQQTFRRSD